MSWQASAVMHEARAGQLTLELERERARSAQLEDELTLSREQIAEAYEFTKPPINIDTSRTISSGGDLALPPAPDNSKVQAIVAISSVLGFVITLWLLIRNK